ncbi:MAG TPA: aromatic amino acid hydroxylase [Polyangiaceae bacterium]|nr:aromatic amino acid hydroxylase [Polyangiaceae bacterium]
MASVSSHVPPHLRRFVVSQEYGQYTAIDQAVWRFVLLQMRARLVETAHPAYAEGLAATGISIDRIPSIVEMNDKLGRFGWGAVCVDGFIPPRAFQEFQSRGLLPIAADMRTREHIAYTPAPDIIHEGAGHAPILAEPAYAAYLRRIGDVAKRAFSLPEEERVFQASYLLSEVKEDPSRTPESVARVEAELAEALASVPEDSEATWLSRLYWWTAEYGLVGRVDDYRMYGAGLLSSLGESHSCHAPGVRKLPLDAACIEIGYDITRPQPQLFVARDFEELHLVLEQVSQKLAVTRGGAVALERAAKSGELASLRFSSGAWAMGVLREVGPSLESPAWLRLAGPAQLARDGRIHPAERELRPPEQWLLPGTLPSGVTLEGLVTRATETGEPLHLQLSYGARVEGRLARPVYDEDGRILHLELEDARLELPEHPPVLLERYAFVLLGNFVTAEAGAVDPTFHAETKFSSIRVPKPRHRAEREAALVALYERVGALPSGGDVKARAGVLEAVHETLAKDEPREWLLRWNLLEKALETPGAQALARTLGAELEALELAYERREPIAMGLGFLRGR